MVVYNAIILKTINLNTFIFLQCPYFIYPSHLIDNVSLVHDCIFFFLFIGYKKDLRSYHSKQKVPNCFHDIIQFSLKVCIVLDCITNRLGPLRKAIEEDEVGVN